MLFGRFSEHIRNQNWFAVVLDFFVVVLGIFAALQVDNWNQSRLDKVEETFLLEALSRDFETNTEILAEVRLNHQMVADVGQAIITYGEAGQIPIDERPQFELFLSSHGARFVFAPVMGSVDNLLGTDRINLISNSELVASLTRWPQLVTKLNAAEMAARDHYQERIYPFLASRIDLEDHDKGFHACCFNDPDTGEVGLNRMEYPWDQQPSGAYLLIADQEFLNLIYWHWVLSMNKLQNIRDVEASLQSIRSLLVQELAR